MHRVFLIDTDTASDDAVALIMALCAPDVRVAAVTTVAGNVSVDQATRNALYTLELCASDVPVYRGAEKPLLCLHQDARWYHGDDGLGDHIYSAPRRAAEERHAVEAIIEIAESTPGLVLVTLGPLTNIALAVALKPRIVANISRCVVMGGAPCIPGNVTPVAEYNVWADPEAARIVFHSGLPLEVVGLHLSRGEATLGPENIEFISGFHTERARFAMLCNSRARATHLKETGTDGITLADPVAMSIALDPTIGICWGRHFVDIETGSELTRSMTVVDRFNIAADAYNRSVWAPLIEKGPNAKVCWTIAIDRWKEALYAALR
jgi:purine nucleosidase